MVLYKRKPIQACATQELPSDPSTKVWIIPQTKEYFLKYQDYLDRMDYYKTPNFVCEVTGNSCLTYFEALESELKEVQLLNEKFPEKLKEPILKYLHFNTNTRMDSLVDEVYAKFKNDYYPGEVIYLRHGRITLDDQRTLSTANANMDERAYIIREKARFNAVHDADGKVVRNAYCCYRLSKPQTGQELTLDESQIHRDRSCFTKFLMKSFIKHSVQKGSTQVGAPWVVRPQYVKQFSLNMEWPPELLKFKEDKVARKRRRITPQLTATPEVKDETPAPEEPVVQSRRKELCDDLELNEPATRPSMEALEEFPELAHKLLNIYQFLVTFPHTLKLSSFTFDEFFGSFQDDSTLIYEIILALCHQFYGKEWLVWYPEIDEVPDVGSQTKFLNFCNVPWQDRVTKNQGQYWSLILLGVMNELLNCSHGELCAEVIRQMTSEVEARSGYKQIERNFNAMDISYKVDCMWVLCEMLVCYGEGVRSKIEECMEQSSSLRGDRIRIVRDIKTEQASESKNKAEKVQELEQARDELDTKLKCMDLQRVKPLGKDRYGNLYWWFECNGVAVESYLMGRLWVQGPQKHDIMHLYSGKDLELYESREVGEEDTPLARKIKEEGDNPLWTPTDWAYVPADQLSVLRDWLNPKGTRENALLKELNNHWEEIESSYKGRQERQELPEDERDVYVNQICIDEMGKPWLPA